MKNVQQYLAYIVVLFTLIRNKETIKRKSEQESYYRIIADETSRSREVILTLYSVIISSWK